MKIFTVLITFLFFNACAQYRGQVILEKRGDESLKKISHIPEDMYIGRAHGKFSEKESINRALDDVRRQIIQKMGVVAELELIDYSLETEELISYYTSTYSRITGEHFLQIKPERIYVEKIRKKINSDTLILYNSYLLVRFSYQEILDSQLRILSKIKYKINEVFQRNFEGQSISDDLNYLIATINDILIFESNSLPEESLLQFDIYRDFLHHRNNLFNKINYLISNIDVNLKFEYSKFDRSYLMELSYGGFSLKRIPVTVFFHKNNNYTEVMSDNLGRIRLSRPEVNELITIIPGYRTFLDHDLIASEQKKFTVYSVFEKSIINLYIEPQANYNIRIFTDRIEQLLKNEGYNLTKNISEADFVLKCLVDIKVSERKISGNFVVESTINVELFFQDYKIMSDYIIPNEMIPEVRGYGTTIPKAVQNSISLENTPAREVYWSTLISRINSEIRRYILTK